MEINEDMLKTLAEYSPSYATVKEWDAEFKWDRNNTDDDHRSGRLENSTTHEQFDAIDRMALNGRCLTVQKLTTSTGISSVSVYTLVTGISVIRKLSGR